MKLLIKRAEKKAFPLRVALYGAIGAGTLPCLMGLSKNWGRVVVIDWLRQVPVQFPGVEYIEPQTNTIEEAGDLLMALAALPEGRPDAVILHGLSRCWSGPGGALDYVGALSRRNRGESGDGWRNWDAAYESFITAFRSFPGHIGATMIAKEKKESALLDGKPKVYSVGLEPEMKCSFLLDNQICGLVMEQSLYVSASLYSPWDSKVFPINQPELGSQLVEWSGWNPAQKEEVPETKLSSVASTTTEQADGSLMAKPAPLPSPAETGSAESVHGVDWRKAQVHGGPLKGKSLGELTLAEMTHLESIYRPKNPNADQRALRLAIDQWLVEQKAVAAAA